ncbi:hypothetical protein DSM3645_03038 [Blastopirellula marina DSM 3645]|uniref:Uncharacterized protein n=1 Tax=Blastopirellula marina DSM 3645 TaxID=314230 RepID=A3ZVS1_9BACT|nr:hypothetical protein DSM3645_03038 [Blastopirellula marina DSM 3645]
MAPQRESQAHRRHAWQDCEYLGVVACGPEH